MRAEELRIGNLITDIWASEGSAFEVVSLSGKHTIVKYGAKFSAKIENLRPVPITEDWLKRFGYAFYNGKTDGDMTLDFGGKLDIDFIDGKIKVKSHYETEIMYREIKHVKYVHQLQNLYYCLTGEDLKLN